jgi:phospholipase D1/2
LINLGYLVAHGRLQFNASSLFTPPFPLSPSKMEYNRATLVFVVICLLALASGPSSAFSLKNLFKGRRSEASSDADGEVQSSSSRLRQPLLKPEDWFLTKKEITDSRGGVPRSDLAVYTKGNAVKPFTATNEYFSSVYDDLTSTKKGDRVMVAGWNIAPFPLKPEEDPSGAKTGFREVVAGVVKRGGSVNILAWANIKHREDIIAARKSINKIPASKVNGARAKMILDDRLPHAISSHHQKTVVIAANRNKGRHSQPVAYIGGVDFDHDRWDTIHHNASAVRDAANISVDYEGWMDSHLRVHGPAAKDIASNFLARWNSDHLPCQGLGDEVLDYENPSYRHLPLLDYASSKTSSSLGSQNVQIVRTYSCSYDHYDEFAPLGENSLFHARLKAIRNAKNFIYIEDQYFILVPELLDALMEAMPRIQKLIVVTNQQTKPVSTGGYIKYSYEMISPILKAYPHKFNLYATKADREIYVHTKLVVIDDVYVSVGSSNWNRRSMTSDSEIAANIVDSDAVKSPDGVVVKKFARDVRIRKFHESTGLSYEELDAMTFAEASEALGDSASDEDGPGILQHMTVDYEAYFPAILNSIRKVSDPQDTCAFDGTQTTQR